MAGHLAHGPANRGRRVLQAAAPLFICEPGQPPRGGAVVIHGVRGLTHETEAACRLLARDGWFAAAPLLYHEHGGTVFPESDQAGARAELASLPLATLAADLAAAVSYLSGRGIGAPAVIGFGTGGHLAAWAAASLDGLCAVISVAPVTAPGDVPPRPALAAASRVPHLELPAAEEPWPRIRAFLRAQARQDTVAGPRLARPHLPFGRYRIRRRAMSQTPSRSFFSATSRASFRSAGVSSPFASRNPVRSRACPRSDQMNPCSSFL